MAFLTEPRGGPLRLAATAAALFVLISPIYSNSIALPIIGLGLFCLFSAISIALDWRASLILLLPLAILLGSVATIAGFNHACRAHVMECS